MAASSSDLRLPEGSFLYAASEEMRQGLLAVAQRRILPGGEVLFREGEPGDSFYLVQRGEIEISVHAADGRKLSLDVIREGEAFGEIALFGGNRTATARALAQECPARRSPGRRAGPAQAAAGTGARVHRHPLRAPARPERQARGTGLRAGSGPTRQPAALPRQQARRSGPRGGVAGGVGKLRRGDPGGRRQGPGDMAVAATGSRCRADRSTSSTARPSSASGKNDQINLKLCEAVRRGAGGRPVGCPQCPVTTLPASGVRTGTGWGNPMSKMSRTSVWSRRRRKRARTFSSTCWVPSA